MKVQTGLKRSRMKLNQLGADQNGLKLDYMETNWTKLNLTK